MTSPSSETETPGCIDPEFRVQAFGARDPRVESLRFTGVHDLTFCGPQVRCVSSYGSDSAVLGLGLGVWGLRFRIEGLGSRVWGLGSGFYG